MAPATGRELTAAEQDGLKELARRLDGQKVPGYYGSVVLRFEIQDGVVRQALVSSERQFREKK